MIARPAEYLKAPPYPSRRELSIAWEKLPDDFELPDEPVENSEHPLLAAALHEALELYGFITPRMLIAANFGLCAKIGGKTVVKAPDWLYVPDVHQAGLVRKSYTPHTEGDPPLIVMEFLSDSDNGEYSSRPVYPYGKWFFYEQILQIPYYAIFDPDTGDLEVYRLQAGRYQMQQADNQAHYRIDPMQLALGAWHGTKAERTGNWLRWWDGDHALLLWGGEKLQASEQRVEELLAELQALKG